jgi:hypothetical protein
MSLEQPAFFNIKDLSLDVRLQAIVDGQSKDFTGKKIFSVEFFRQSIAFGITDIEIEVNTSLQPIVTITFKDLYGNTVLGKSKNTNPNLADSDEVDFSVLFNWPPPKFLFTFKGFLGKSSTWMLNMKKSSVSYDSSDGSFNIKCEFVPNQWGFLSDLPFLYLLAVKSLKKQSGLTSAQLEKVQTIFDLIKIGKQVEVKTQETTKEFDGILNQMNLVKVKRIYDSLDVNKIVNFDETISGQVGNQTINPFNSVKFITPTGTGNSDILTIDARRAYVLNNDNGSSSQGSTQGGSNLTKLNNFLLLTAQIDSRLPINITIKDLQYSNGNLTFNGSKILPNGSNIDTELSNRIELISDNVKHIEDAIKLKVYNSSKTQLQKITIGEIFSQLAQDAGYIMGRILEAGYQGYKANGDVRKNNKNIIGKNFPMIITSQTHEEKPATIVNAGTDFGVEEYELAFVRNFIQAVSEGIVTELSTDADANSTVGNNVIKKRISNLEAIRSNPYKPFYQNIAENILIRGGIVAYLVRSPDPNYPGDYNTKLGVDRGTNASDIIPLADSDLENISDAMLTSLTYEEATKLKNFCTFWNNLLSDDCENLLTPDTSNGGKLIAGDSISGYLSVPGAPLTAPFTSPLSILDYPVLIQAPPQWNGKFGTDSNGVVQTDTLRNMMSTVFKGKPSNSTSSEFNDSTNSNFIDLNSLQAVKVLNNGISYFKPLGSVNPSLGPLSKTKYVFVEFSGPDATDTQKVASADSDSSISADASKQKDSNEPVGFVNIVSPFDDSGQLFKVVKAMNSDGINQGLLFNYSRLINPNNDFFKDNTLLTSSGETFFTVNNKFDNGTNAANTIPANNIALSVVFHPSNDLLTFGPFADTEASLAHRGYIKRFCNQLLTRINGIEQKRNQVVSETLGKAAEQEDLIYKQMHVLYQQWETLIVLDSASADGQNANGLAVNSIANDLSTRYDNSKHLNYDFGSAIADNAADNTFLYGYPLNLSTQSKNVDVKNSIINIDSLYKPNGNTTVLNIIQQICTKNNFIFIPMPGEPGAFSTQDIYSVHQPTTTPKIKNFFYVQFAPTPESRATIDNSSKTPLSSSQNAANFLPPGTLEIKFGSTDNQIIKNITVDTQESKTTAESIVNLQRLVDNENQNKTVTTDCSMLPVMEGRSYKATAHMLGNAQVFPMQFFYLNSNPLFNGLYQIMKVTHSIKPNDMTTMAEGIRMRMDFGTGNSGGIQPITLDSLASLPVTLTQNEAPILSPGDFANAVLDQGVGLDDGRSGTNSAGFSGTNFSPLINRGSSDIVPNTFVTNTGVILLSNIRNVQNAIRLTQSSDENGAAPISDFVDSKGNVIYTKENIITNMNQFITDVIDPFAAFLRQNYPKLFKNWYITSATRSYVPNGGSSKSQHQIGQAFDSKIVGLAPGIETMNANLELLNAMLTWYRQNPIGYDQILWETRASQNASWIHWSYVRNNNKVQLLRFSSDRINRNAPVNTTGKYVNSGVSPQQILLTMS